MAKVEVSGLPNTAKLQSIVFHTQRILSKDGIKKFWIRELADMRGTDKRMATMEFQSPYDANKAQRRLDGFIYIYRDGSKHPLRAQIEGAFSRRSRSPQFRERGRRRGRSPKFERHFSKSRSPLPRSNMYHSEASKLDMELELLRKQRQVIEEERKLLMERKKLELLKDIDPSIARELEYVDRMDQDEDYQDNYRYNDRRYDNRDFADDRMPNRRYNTEERSYIKRPYYVNKSPEVEMPFAKPRKTRKFFKCSQYILKDMEDLISKVTPNEDIARILTSKVRGTIRKRIEVALENEHNFLPSEQINELYRKLYPISTDEILIKQLIKELNIQTLTEGDVDPWSEINNEKQIKKMDKSADVASTPKRDQDFVEVPRNTSDVNYANSDDAAVSLNYEEDRNWIDGNLENF